MRLQPSSGVDHSSRSFCSQNSRRWRCFSASFSDLERLSRDQVRDFVSLRAEEVFVFVRAIVGGLGADAGSVGWGVGVVVPEM